MPEGESKQRFREVVLEAEDESSDEEQHKAVEDEGVCDADGEILTADSPVAGNDDERLGDTAAGLVEGPQHTSNPVLDNQPHNPSHDDAG